ncbi:MAG: homoserine kinase [Burkholderiaceae bacterium]|nr:homoserine kinase [Burkholderiaceae bacterium]
MAVFTPVTLEQITPWAARFPIGTVRSIKGISSGIENSNFFLSAERGEFVLTIFEKLSFEQLPFYLHLMRHLAERGVSVPAPIASDRNEIINALHGKPAAIVTRLEGDWIPAPAPVHCREVGAMLAKMHVAAQDYPLYQPNLRGLEWWRETTPVVLPYIPEEAQQLLRAEMHFQEAFAASDVYDALPNGPIHADLFRNNVMFDGERLSGFFDFFFAGCDTWLFDVAVTVNDWCIALDTGASDPVRVRAMLDAYADVRPFTDEERRAWPAMLRAAALRFWLSRLFDYYLPREAEMLTPHDPTHFERILRHRIAHPVEALA